MVIQARSNVQKPVKVYEHVDARNTSFLFASKQPDSTLKATAIRKENVNSVYVKNEVRKPVPTVSVVHPRKYETNEVDDDDDDECMVTRGQKFVQNVESRPGKLTSPKTVMNDDKFSSEQGNGGEDGVYDDEYDDIGYKSCSSGLMATQDQNTRATFPS
ncbi:hypothetical protein Tco_0011716 [Tanacetum coccineum]